MRDAIDHGWNRRAGWVNHHKVAGPGGLLVRLAYVVMLIAGIVLFVSPWYSITWFNPDSSWNAWILAVPIMLVAIWALVSIAPAFMSWMMMLLSLWVFISPWLIGFATPTNLAAWSDWMIGGVIFLLAAWILLENRSPTIIDTFHQQVK
jgi:hypothetical protein